MVREIKEHDERKKQMIQTAQHLFLNRGYEHTSVQDIIDTMGVAKGTFYHYFKSREELLDAIVDQMTTDMHERLELIPDKDSNATEKFIELFRTGSNFKAENIDVFMILIKTLYRDDNAIIRNRMYQSSLRKNGPLISRIVCQGIKEGLFNTPFPEDIAGMMITIGKELNETVISMILDRTTDPAQLCAAIIEKYKMYQDIIERILGADPGSLAGILPRGIKDLIIRFITKAREDKETEMGKDRYRMY